MRDGLQEIGRGLPFPTCVAGYGSIYILHFQATPPVTVADLASHNDELFIRYRQGLIKRGVFETPMTQKRGHIGLAHSEADVDATLNAAQDALTAVATGG